MPASSRQDIASRDEQPPARLAATVVTYEDRPDRRTVYPLGTSSVARMSTWLSADADAFVDLAATR